MIPHYNTNWEQFFVQNKMMEGAVFLDCGTDLGSGRLVPGKLHFFHFS